MNDYLKKASHPGVTWAVIIAAVGLSGQALYAVNDVENLAHANSLLIGHEKELRISESAGVKEDLKELKQDTKELAQSLKEETTAIKNLLQQLLLRQAGVILPLPLP